MHIRCTYTYRYIDMPYPILEAPNHSHGISPKSSLSLSLYIYIYIFAFFS